MVVTRKVRPKKDEPETSTAPVATEAVAEAVIEVVEKVVPDVEEFNDENDPGEDESNLDEAGDETVEESIENIKTEIEEGTGKRVPKPSFKVKYAGQKLSGNYQLLTWIFVSYSKESRFQTEIFTNKSKIQSRN